MSTIGYHDVVVTLLQTPAEEAAYARFLESCPAATIYHSLPYRDLVLRCTRGRARYGLAWRGADVIGALPLVVIDGPLGPVANSLPFFGSYGDILTSDADAAAALRRWFHDQIEHDGIIAATVISNPFDDAPQAQWKQPEFVDERIAQWTLLADAQNGAVDLRAVIDGSARRNLAKARADRVSVEIDDTALDFLAECHRQNMAEIGGLNKPGSFFSALPAAMVGGRDYRIYVAKRDGNPIAAVLVFLYKHFVEYIMPVTAPGNREHQPTAAIILRAMQDAQSDGRQIWNWGGTWTSQTGVYRFKKKWGATEKRYSYRTYVRDERILGQTAEALTSGYPFFFVVPFAALTEVGVVA